MFAELKECFMEAFDDNKDDKIEIREVSRLIEFEQCYCVWTIHSK